MTEIVYEKTNIKHWSRGKHLYLSVNQLTTTHSHPSECTCALLQHRGPPSLVPQTLEHSLPVLSASSPEVAVRPTRVGDPGAVGQASPPLPSTGGRSGGRGRAVHTWQQIVNNKPRIVRLRSYQLKVSKKNWNTCWALQKLSRYYWKFSDNLTKFLDTMESFQYFCKVLRHSVKFPDTLKDFQTLQKVSWQSWKIYINYCCSIWRACST